MNRVLLTQATEPGEPAVNFLQFNRDIWGADNADCTGFWCGIRQIVDDSNRIEGFETPGAFLTTLLPYLFVFAGLILFVMLVWGSFEIMMGAASQKSVDSGKKRITSALIGFLILFSSYWIAQILQVIFGIRILG